MSLPKDYNNALHQHANFYAAWFPLAIPFKIGDYGLIQNGVFQKIGHLSDLKGNGFNVEVRTETGPTTSMDFLSEGVISIKTVAGGTVPNLPAVDVEAKLTYEFQRKNSFVVKAAEMNVEQMGNIREVADELAQMRRDDRWSHRYHVVSATYTGCSCLVLLSSEAETKVEFVATAKALKQLDLGNVEVKPSVSFSSNRVLHSIGNTGVIGLSLFKLGFFSGDLKVLASSRLTDEERKIEEDWGDELKDEEW